MTDIGIDKNIPIPATAGKKVGKYPWRLMEIGDSFLIPCEDEAKRERTYRRMAAAYGHYKPMRFVSCKVEGGVRVWRTA